MPFAMPFAMPSSPLRPLLSVAGGALLAVTALACAPDTGPGTLTVTYTLGNDKTCAEVGVDTVRVRLVRSEEVIYTEDAPCTEGEVVIESISPNTYELEVVGIDDNFVPTFDNLGDPATERRVEIFEAASADEDVDLTARPAELKVRWRLGEGGFANCEGVGIDAFEIKAYQDGGGSLLLEDVLDCELEGDTMGYRLIDDPERVLNGTWFGEVGIQALDAAGDPVGDIVPFEFTPPGPGYPVEVGVECTDIGCTPEP